MEFESQLRLWGPTALLIVGMSLMLGLVYDQLTEQTRTLVADGDVPTELIDDQADRDADGSVTGLTAAIAPPPSAAEPRRWTVLEASSAIESVAIDGRELIADGVIELPEFGDLNSSDQDRARRDRRRFTSWGRIWRNRVDLLDQRMPPMSACQRHTAILDACGELRSILEGLDGIAVSGDIEIAASDLDALDQRLEVLLAPPPDLTEAVEPELDSEPAGSESLDR